MTNKPENIRGRYHLSDTPVADFDEAVPDTWPCATVLTIAETLGIPND